MRFIAAALVVCFAVTGCRSIPPAVWKAMEATRLVKAGSEATEKGEIDAAIEKFEKALGLTPNAPRYRFAYAELLYWKALSYSQASHREWQKTLGREFVDDIAKWENSSVKLSEEEKEKLVKESAENKREGIVYFNKCLRHLVRCDNDWDYAVEAVPLAMGMVYIFLEKYDNAIEAFERVHASARVSDKYREQIGKVIKLVKGYKKELGHSPENDGAGSYGP